MNGNVIPDEYEKVVRSSLNMLSYQELTAKALERKLNEKHGDPEATAFALRYVISKGFLDEERYLERLVERLADCRLFGVNRIAREIYAKGFDTALVRERLKELLSKYDFEEICMKNALRSGKKDRKKLYDHLIRQGFNPSLAASTARKLSSLSEDSEDE